MLSRVGGGRSRLDLVRRLTCVAGVVQVPLADEVADRVPVLRDPVPGVELLRGQPEQAAVKSLVPSVSTMFWTTAVCCDAVVNRWTASPSMVAPLRSNWSSAGSPLPSVVADRAMSRALAKRPLAALAISSRCRSR
jgi:hypothetical protein